MFKKVTLALAAIYLSVFSLAAQAHDTIKFRHIEITNPWARASVTMASAAAFMHITSIGKDDVLLEARSNLGKKTEIHLSSMDANGVMSMVKQDAVPLPAGQELVLKPGSYHVMFMKLNKKLQEGDTISIELVFEKAGIVSIRMPVLKAGSKGMDHSH